PLGKRFHRVQRAVVGHRRGREGPDITEGHRPKALAHAAAAGAHGAIYVQQGHPIHNHTAELQWGAKWQILEAEADFVDANVGWFCGTDNLKSAGQRVSSGHAEDTTAG